MAEVSPFKKQLKMFYHALFSGVLRLALIFNECVLALLAALSTRQKCMYNIQGGSKK